MPTNAPVPLTTEELDALDEMADTVGVKGKLLRQLTHEVRQSRQAVRWALGELDDFPARQPGQGAYWWRTELRKRAGAAPDKE